MREKQVRFKIRTCDKDLMESYRGDATNIVIQWDFFFLSLKRDSLPLTL